jgi:hypothetical protein
MPDLWTDQKARRALVRGVSTKWVPIAVNLVFWTLVVVIAVFLARYG